MALSQLNPQIIGAEMEHGFAGSYARQPDMIVVTRPVGEKEPLPFGMALMYDANGAVVLMQGSGVTADRFAGVAGREMRSDLGFLPALWAEDGDMVLVDDIASALSRVRHLGRYAHDVAFVTCQDLKKYVRGDGIGLCAFSWSAMESLRNCCQPTHILTASAQ